MKFLSCDNCMTWRKWQFDDKMWKRKWKRALKDFYFFYFEHTMTSTVAFRDRKSFVVPLKVLSYNNIDFCQFSWNCTIILTVVKWSFEPLYYNIRLCKLGKEKSAKVFSFVVSFVKYHRLWNAQLCLRFSAVYQRNGFKVGTLDRRSNKK